MDYVGNTKAFATLEGTRTHHLITGDVSEVNHPRGDHGRFWGQSVTVANYLMEASGWDTVAETDIGGGVIERHERKPRGDFLSRWNRGRSTSSGGAGDPVIFTFKHYPRTQIREQNMGTKAHGRSTLASTRALLKSRQLPMAQDSCTGC